MDLTTHICCLFCLVVLALFFHKESTMEPSSFNDKENRNYPFVHQAFGPFIILTLWLMLAYGRNKQLRTSVWTQLKEGLHC